MPFREVYSIVDDLNAQEWRFAAGTLRSPSRSRWFACCLRRSQPEQYLSRDPKPAVYQDVAPRSCARA